MVFVVSQASYLCLPCNEMLKLSGKGEWGGEGWRGREATES